MKSWDSVLRVRPREVDVLLAPMSPFPAPLAPVLVAYGPDGTSPTQATPRPPEFAPAAQHWDSRTGVLVP